MTGEWMLRADHEKQGMIERKGIVTTCKEKTMWKQTSNGQRGLSKVQTKEVDRVRRASLFQTQSQTHQQRKN